jgi:AcrR family transcriptional regulator
MQEVFGVTKEKTGQSGPEPARERILQGAMKAFMELGYSETSTLEIATRARVSKRELYTLFGNKQAILAAGIAHRVQRMPLVPKLPEAHDREALATILIELGAVILREVLDPHVVAVFRLAIAEAQRAPEVAQTLEMGRQTIRRAVSDVIVQAHSAGLLGTREPTDMSYQYLSLLFGDSMVSVLLRVREAPGPAEADRRARAATADFLRLNPSAK